VKIELKVVSKAVLTAKVCGGLKNCSLTSAVSTLAPSSQSSGPPKIKRKGKAKNNWRERPVRARPHGPFQRTLPGELSRAIILTRVNNRQSIPLMENAMSASNATVGDTMEANAADGSIFLNGRQVQGRESRLRGRSSRKRKIWRLDCFESIRHFHWRVTLKLRM
jgi:hypothetical protein